MLARAVLVAVVVLLLRRLPEEAAAAARCPRATTEELREKLGAAYNARYMSIEKPPPDPDPAPRLYVRHTVGYPNDDEDNGGGSGADMSRTQWNEDPPSFRVDPDFRRDVARAETDGDAHSGWQPEGSDDETLSGVPSDHWLRRAASGSDGGVTPGSRVRREDGTKKPWGCEARMEWEDLGEDRFPRYLRTVRCLGEQCWFTHFRCQGRAFTVNVLRRASVEPPCDGRATSDSLPADLREEWVFEERAVTFCCDCAKEEDD